MKHIRSNFIPGAITLNYPHKICFPNSASIRVTDQNGNFLAFFVRILAKLVNFDVKMFRLGDFDVKIARIWKILPKFLILFDVKVLKNFHEGRLEVSKLQKSFSI